MPIRITASATGTRPGDQVRAFAATATAAVEAGLRGVREGVLTDLRQDIARSFPGSRRLPTTVTATVYPGRDDGRPPTLWVHPRRGSNAGRILGAQRGTTIVPTKAGTALAIPTRRVPRSRPGGAQMTPDQVSKHFGERLTLVPAKAFGGGGRVWGYLVLRNQTVGKGGRVRAATAGRARQGRKAQTVVMFVLVPVATLPPRLRPEETVQRWADLAPRQIEQAARTLGIA